MVQLVESYRNAEGQARQRVVVSLGDAALPKVEVPAIARVVENHLAAHSELLPAGLSEEAAGWVPRILQLAARSKSARSVCSQSVDGVVVDRVQSENIVQFGQQLVALAAWENLGLTPMRQEAGLNASQVAIGMAFDACGLALGHDVLEGNIAETKHWPTGLSGSPFPASREPPNPFVLDAGLASQANIALLKERGLRYVVNITRSRRARYAEDFGAGGFEPVPGRDPQSPVEVKTIPDPDEPEGSLVLCRSALRREKESAMLSRAESRFLGDLAALRERIGTDRLKSQDKIQRAIRRLQKKHPRAARFSPLRHIGGTLEATRDEERHADATARRGDYVLKTERTLSAAETWALYMILLQAKQGFAFLKGSLMAAR